MSATPIKSECNSCGKATEHDVVHEEVVETLHDEHDITRKKAIVVCCRGCRDTAIRLETWQEDLIFGGHDRINLAYRPPRLWRQAPDWLGQLEELAPELKDLMDEVYSATNEKQFRLLAMGIRAAVDKVMTLRVGDIGGFEQKLKEMLKQNHINEKQKEMLAIVIDAASAAAHRGFCPPQELLREMVITAETIIRDYYITGPALNNLKTVIPPRPDRP